MASGSDHVWSVELLSGCLFVGWCVKIERVNMLHVGLVLCKAIRAAGRRPGANKLSFTNWLVVSGRNRTSKYG